MTINPGFENEVPAEEEEQRQCSFFVVVFFVVAVSVLCVLCSVTGSCSKAYMIKKEVLKSFFFSVS